MELMIDIETLDVGHRSVILSIGLQPFSEHDIPPGWLIRPSVEQQLNSLGRTVSLSTIRFWANQPLSRLPAVQEAMVGEEDRVSVEVAVKQIADIIGAHAPIEGIWARGDIFDLGNLASLFRDARLPLPWLYNKPRDLRTLISEAQKLGWQYPQPDAANTPHTALGDCREQVEQLLSIRGFFANMSYSAEAYGVDVMQDEERHGC